MAASKKTKIEVQNRRKLSSPLWLIMLLILLLSNLSICIQYQKAFAARVEDDPILAKASAAIAFKREYLSDILGQLENQVRILADNPFTQAYVSSNTKPELDNLTQLFLTVSTANEYYMQVRFLDAKGQERVRIDRPRDGYGPRIIPDKELQDKSSRGYFKFTKKLPRGQLWNSKFDLNRERGAIEQPINPTFRVASPVYSGGKFSGMVIINLAMSRVASVLNDSTDFMVYLVDGDGEFLLHPDPKHAWSRYLPGRTGYQKDSEVVHKTYSHSLEDLFKNREEIRLILQPIEAGKSPLLENGLSPILNLTSIEKAWIAAHPFIQVHNEQAWPPFNYYEHGTPKGFSIEYMNLLAFKVGLEVGYISGPEWNDFLNMIRNKTLDVMLNIVKTEERQEYILFTKPYARNPNVIVSMATSPVTSMQALSGKTVSVIPGFFHEEILKRSFPSVKLLPAENVEECLKAVAFGNADAMLGELSVVKYLMTQNMLTNLQVSGEVKIGNPEIVNLRIGVRNDWPILVDILEKAMAAVTPSEMAALKSKWMAKDDDEFELTVAEAWWLKAHPKLSLGIDPDWPPFEYYNAQGEHAGISADYVRLLEKRLSVTIVLQKHLETWAQVMEQARAGEIDILAAVGRTDEREKFLEFTEPYLEQSLVIVTHKEAPPVPDIKALMGKTVAVQRDTVHWDYVSQMLPDQELMAVDTLTEALQGVSKGQADAAIGMLTAINYLERKLGIDNLQVASITPFTLEVSFAVRKDIPILAGILNRALASIHPEEKSLIYDKWVNVEVAQRIDWAKVWKVALSIAGVVLIIFGFILRSNQKLTREASKRKVQEKRFRALLEGAPDAMVIVDEKGLIQRINYQTEKVFGYNRNELLGQTIEILVPEEIRKQHPQLRQAYMDNPSANGADETFSLRAQHKDGTIFPVDINLSPLETEEGALVVASVRDVTERKKAENRLRLTQYAMDMAVHAIFWLSPDDGRFLYVNGAAAQQMGYSREEFLKMKASDIDLYLSPERWSIIVEQLSRQDSSTVESRHRRKDGAIRNVMVTNYLNEYEGSIIIVAFVEDITERKKDEDQIRKLSNAVEQSPVWVVITDTEGTIEYINPRFTQITGYQASEAIGKNPNVLSSGQTTQEFYKEMWSSILDGEPWSGNLLNRRKNGELFWAHLYISSVRGADGAITHFIGLGEDITDQKALQEEREAAEAKYRELVENANSIIVKIDRQGLVTFFNEFAQTFFGFSAEEILGKSAVGTIIPEQESTGRNMNEMFEDIVDHPERYEYNENENITKNGDRVWVSWTNKAVFANDNPSGIELLCIGKDITDQKALQGERDDAFNVISSSIRYASNIQESILPHTEGLEAVFPEHLILWEPRDQVGGDIYFLKPWGLGKIFALGDCTGHGVPGAFMTMISNGALDMAIMETQPGDSATLLQRTHQLIQKSLGQQNKESKSDDGIDVGLCYIAPRNRKIVFSGARFSLFIVENQDVREIKGNKKFGLGYCATPHNVEFANIDITVDSKRTFYMTSDGMLDQVGGPKRRGFGKKRFKKLLLKMESIPMDHRRAFIKKTLAEYQGEEIRRDDVSMVGFSFGVPKRGV
jgi:PAS domain S-box-containing protein